MALNTFEEIYGYLSPGALDKSGTAKKQFNTIVIDDILDPRGIFVTYDDIKSHLSTNIL